MWFGAISTEVVIRDHHQFSEFFFSFRDLSRCISNGAELEVLSLLIGDQALYWEFTEVLWDRTISVEASTTLRLARSERLFGAGDVRATLTK